MVKVRTNLPVSFLSAEQKKEFKKWVLSNRTFINFPLSGGRVFSARKEC